MHVSGLFETPELIRRRSSWPVSWVCTSSTSSTNWLSKNWRLQSPDVPTHCHKSLFFSKKRESTWKAFVCWNAQFLASETSDTIAPFTGLSQGCPAEQSKDCKKYLDTTWNDDDSLCDSNDDVDSYLLTFELNQSKGEIVSKGDQLIGVGSKWSIVGWKERKQNFWELDTVFDFSEGQEGWVIGKFHSYKTRSKDRRSSFNHHCAEWTHRALRSSWYCHCCGALCEDQPIKFQARTNALVKLAAFHFMMNSSDVQSNNPHKKVALVKLCLL